ncbi:hypothetical protein VKT23_012381 [Stygiomarasmius scandens]|uniref:Uncharacterized protein n=1 Tax=Marasmiellus scandens TaxID=2682957 RepID=A0ABR1J8J4_9AGAR
MSGKSESTTSLLSKSSSQTTPKKDENTTPTKKPSSSSSDGNSPTSESHSEFANKAKENGWGSSTPTGASLGA